MDADVFWATTVGAMVGGLVPIVAQLVLRPSESRRQRRAKLYLDLVPAALLEAKAFRNEGGPYAIPPQDLDPFEREATLAGREDRRVARSVSDASAAAAWFDADGRSSAKDLPNSRTKVLGTYLINELTSYHEWLSHSLGRNPTARRRARQSRRNSQDWMRDADAYLNVWRDRARA